MRRRVPEIFDITCERSFRLSMLKTRSGGWIRFFTQHSSLSVLAKGALQNPGMVDA